MNINVKNNIFLKLDYYTLIRIILLANYNIDNLIVFSLVCKLWKKDIYKLC